MLPKLLRGTQTIAAVCCSLIAARIIGWQDSPTEKQTLARFALAAVVVFIAAEAATLIGQQAWKRDNRKSPTRVVSAILLASLVSIPSFYMIEEGEYPSPWTLAALFLTAIMGLSRVVNLTKSRWLSRWHPGLVGIAAFATTIVIGACLLKAPNAAADPEPIGWNDAFFTSASAVCVTGLITLDTENDFTRLGQVIILLLIQAGGLGIMTWTYLVALASGQSVSLRDRIILDDLLKQSSITSFKRRLGYVLGITVTLEFIGVGLLYLIWHDGWATSLDRAFHSLFHGVSAFCNAGFSTFSENLMKPHARGSPAALIVIGNLIVIGGLGAPVWIDLIRKPMAKIRSARSDVEDNQPEPSFLNLHSRIAITTTFCLLAFGLVALSVIRNATSEGIKADWTVSLFDSITARAAGFNIENVGEYSHVSMAVLMALMFIGGSPGGTAGGIKTTTFAVLWVNLRQIIRDESRANIWKRRLSDTVIRQALAIVTLAGVWIFCAAVALQWLHPSFAFMDILFETVSAFGTVGLSRGITAELSPLAKWIIIATMFVGRLGIVLVFTSLLPERPSSRVAYPEESPLLT